MISTSPFPPTPKNPPDTVLSDGIAPPSVTTPPELYSWFALTGSRMT